MGPQPWENESPGPQPIDPRPVCEAVYAQTQIGSKGRQRRPVAQSPPSSLRVQLALILPTSQTLQNPRQQSQCLSRTYTFILPTSLTRFISKLEFFRLEDLMRLSVRFGEKIILSPRFSRTIVRVPSCKYAGRPKNWSSFPRFRQRFSK